MLKGATGSIESITRSIASARVDLNLHHIDASLFALRSPLSKGSVLGDEVGLGKTIEAGMVIAQRWAERRRRILLIVPAILRKQWQQELEEKFYLPSVILESRLYKRLQQNGSPLPETFLTTKPTAFSCYCLQKCPSKTHRCHHQTSQQCGKVQSRVG